MTQKSCELSSYQGKTIPQIHDLATGTTISSSYGVSKLIRRQERVPDGSRSHPNNVLWQGASIVGVAGWRIRSLQSHLEGHILAGL